MPAIAKLRKLPISPRKTQLVATLIQRMRASKALQVLERVPNRSAYPLAKLLKSAIANYQSREGQGNTTPEELYIQTIHIGSAGMLKRVKPAPRGTAHRIRKRMTHITLIVEKSTPITSPKRSSQKPKKVTKNQAPSQTAPTSSSTKK